MRPLSTTPKDILDLTWKDIEPHYRELAEQPSGKDNLTSWLSAWSRTAEIVNEFTGWF